MGAAGRALGLFLGLLLASLTQSARAGPQPPGAQETLSGECHSSEARQCPDRGAPRTGGKLTGHSHWPLCCRPRRCARRARGEWPVSEPRRRRAHTQSGVLWWAAAAAAVPAAQHPPHAQPQLDRPRRLVLVETEAGERFRLVPQQEGHAGWGGLLTGAAVTVKGQRLGPRDGRSGSSGDSGRLTAFRISSIHVSDAAAAASKVDASREFFTAAGEVGTRSWHCHARVAVPPCRAS